MMPTRNGNNQQQLPHNDNSNTTRKDNNVRRTDVMVGKIYLAKVSNKFTYVRITEDIGVRLTGNHAGWYAINLETDRKVHIRTAGRLRDTTTNQQQTA